VLYNAMNAILCLFCLGEGVSGYQFIILYQPTQIEISKLPQDTSSILTQIQTILYIHNPE